MEKKIVVAPKNSSLLQFFNLDGMLDVVTAAVLVNFGLDVFNQSEFTSLFTWIPILLFNSIKYSYTLKRVPAETFGEDGKKMRMWIFIPTLFLVIGVVVLAFVVLQDTFNLAESGSGRLLHLLSGVIVALFCLIPAVWVPLKRFYVYSGIALFIGLINYFVLPGYAFFFATGLVIAVLGGLTVRRFAQNYPLLEPPKQEHEE